MYKHISKNNDNEYECPYQLNEISIGDYVKCEELDDNGNLIDYSDWQLVTKLIDDHLVETTETRWHIVHVMAVEKGIEK